MIKKKILVIEDETVITELIGLLLENEGYEVINLKDNRGVKEQLNNNNISLVLLDLTLGGQDGMDVCDFIKGSESFKHIPVVLVSAHRDLENIAGGCGADGFILKPFDLASFGKRIQEFINDSNEPLH